MSGIDTLFSLLLIRYGYIVLVPAVIVTGPLAALLAGVFSRLDFFNPFVAYVCLVLGAMLGDMMWYFLGRRYGEPFTKRFGHYVGLTHEHIVSAKELFTKYHSPIILLTKVTNVFGLMIPVLFTAGISRIPFGRFFVLNLLGESIFSGVLITLGYYFSDLYLRIDDFFGRTLLVGVVCMLLLIGLGFGKYVRNRIYGEHHL